MIDIEDLVLKKRLERLIDSGLLPKEDVEEFMAELSEIREEIEKRRETVIEISKTFKALSHLTRLKILMLLDQREMCVCELTAILDATQPTISHHLNILENIGLIEEKRRGRWIFYSLAKTEMMEYLRQLLKRKGVYKPDREGG